MNMQRVKEARELLLDALTKVKEYGLRQREKHERRLGKDIWLPADLSDLLRGLTKQEMVEIRQTLKITGLSALNKAELADALVRILPAKYKYILACLDKQWYDLVKAMTKHGVLKVNDLTVEEVEALRRYGFLFSGIYQGEKCLYMSQELRRVFERVDGLELQNKIRRNTEWVRLTYGLLYYYGVMRIGQLRKKVTQLTGRQVDLKEFI